MNKFFLVFSIFAFCNTGFGGQEGGGANGINGKPLESYVVDIEGLPEYQEHIEPVLFKLRQKLPRLVDDLKRMNRTKNAYFVPVTLPEIPHWIIGTYFETDQLAIQTSSELWISSRPYQRMNLRNRAIVLLHEMVMSLFLEANEMFVNCYQYRFNRASRSCGQSQLKVSDYEGVRRLTNVLMNRIDSYTPVELEILLIELGLHQYQGDAIRDNSPIDETPDLLGIYSLFVSENERGGLPKNGDSGCGYKFRFNEGSEATLDMEVYHAVDGKPILDATPLKIRLMSPPTVIPLEKNGVLYSYLGENATNLLRQRLDIFLDKTSIFRIEIYWEKNSYDYRDRSWKWIRSKVGPVGTTAPVEKICY